MLRRNGPVIKCVGSVLRLKESLWWERFVKDVGLEPWVKERGNYGWWQWRVGSEKMWQGAWTGRTETEGLEWGCRRELGSWFQRQGEAYRKERSVIRSKDDVGGRARVISGEEWVLQWGWTEMRLCRYGEWVVVRTLQVSERSLYSMRLVVQPVKRA